jgi:hypothetical protein
MLRLVSVIASLALVLSVAQSSAAQCTGTCGDLDSTGTVTLTGDFVKLLNYVTRGIWTGKELACADVDGFADINARDLQHMAPIFSFGGSLDCAPDTPAVPLENDGYYLHYNSLVPPGDSSVVVHFDVTLAGPIRTLSIPMRIDVDGADFQFGRIDSSAAGGYGWEWFGFGDYRTRPAPPGVLMAGYSTVEVHNEIAPGRYPIGTAEILLDPAPVYRTVHVQPITNPPGDNAPMVVERPGYGQNVTAWAINLAPWVVDLTGDADNNRIINAADLIRLVGFVFKGAGSPYPVPAAGDIDCTGAVASADIIGLAGYVFKSGPAPCDVASECTIALDQWSCP